jgi:hypothetical protein
MSVFTYSYRFETTKDLHFLNIYIYIILIIAFLRMFLFVDNIMYVCYVVPQQLLYDDNIIDDDDDDFIIQPFLILLRSITILQGLACRFLMPLRGTLKPTTV